MARFVSRQPRRIALACVALLLLVPLAVSAREQATESATIYLIAMGDNGQSGMLVGCGDSLIPATVTVPTATTTEGKITAALQHLFSLHDAYYGQSGLYNALYENTLTIDSVSLSGSTAGVILSGGTGSRGTCDDPRIEGQIEQTVLAVSGVTSVVVILNGAQLVDQRGPDFFPETGHGISLPFVTFWEHNGGIPVFGYPISEQLFEGGYRVQYTERQRFEHHPGNSAPYDILLGLLGTQVAQSQGLLGTPAFQYQQPNGNPNCEYVAASGHHLCFGFRSYWHNHGLDFGDPGYSYRESLLLFGYPISEEFVVNGVTVQYFERARFEWHPQNAPPYDILLGRLGVEVHPWP
jgi:hypothetical protein